MWVLQAVGGKYIQKKESVSIDLEQLKGLNFYRLIIKKQFTTQIFYKIKMSGKSRFKIQTREEMDKQSVSSVRKKC